MTSSDLASFESPEPDARIPYGDDPLQFGELRIPEGPGPHPVAILIHGGCWLSEFDITHLRKLAAAITKRVSQIGLEYRESECRAVGPERFRIARARTICGSANQLLTWPCPVVGHSAGGHSHSARRARAHDREPPAESRPRRGLGLPYDLAYLHQRTCSVIDKLLAALTHNPIATPWARPSTRSFRAQIFSRPTTITGRRRPSLLRGIRRETRLVAEPRVRHPR
jgi:hypothetical protein